MIIFIFIILFSFQCCLELFFQNPNIAGEMGQILKINQEKYVPLSTLHDELVVLSRVAQHGDQLYEERGRNVQWAFRDGKNQYDRLEGIRTEFADWHAKFTLYKVYMNHAPTLKTHVKLITVEPQINGVLVSVMNLHYIYNSTLYVY